MILFSQMFLLEKFSFSVINDLGTSSSEMRIIFEVLQIETENSATALLIYMKQTRLTKGRHLLSSLYESHTGTQKIK